MSRPRSDAHDYDWAKARRDFSNCVYPAVIACRLGVRETDVWDRAEVEHWEGIQRRSSSDAKAA